MSRFFFAWIDESSDMSFSSDHHVVDEDIFAFEVSQDENEFAILSIDIRNPNVGLLSAGRKHWAWLSWEKDDLTVTPLFLGRLVAVPSNIDDEIITLEFEARPEHYDEEKAAFADTLRVFPGYDGVFLDENALDDPDNVLQGYSALWHIDRLTGEVSISDIISGEGDSYIFDDDDIFTEDDLDIQIGNQPIRRIDVAATVDWQQSADGEIDLKQSLYNAFANAGSPSLISTYTGQGLEKDWPAPESSIGYGWSFGDTQLTLISGDSITPDYFDAKTRESLMQYEEDVVKWAQISYITVGPPPAADIARFYQWTFRIDGFTVKYDISRDRSETISFSVYSDMQEIETGVDDSGPSKLLTFRSSSISLPIDNYNTGGGEAPIEDVRRTTYFGTDRGKLTLKWLLAVARANLLKSARCVDITATITFENAIQLTCKDNVQLVDDRIPGGEATGKVIGYSFSANGDDGTLIGSVTIGCAIGRGNNLPTVSDGDPLYCNDGYCSDYQQRSGAEIEVFADELKYSDFVVSAENDNVDFFHMVPDSVITELTVSNCVPEQEAVLESGDLDEYSITELPHYLFGYRDSFADIPSATIHLNGVKTTVRLSLKPLSDGPFDLTISPVISELYTPKQIDLEAA